MIYIDQATGEGGGIDRRILREGLCDHRVLSEGLRDHGLLSGDVHGVAHKIALHASPAAINFPF